MRKWVPLPLSPELRERLMHAAGGSEVGARLLLERAIAESIKAEREARDAARRASESKQRRRFGWQW